MVVSVVVVFLSHRDHSRRSVHLHGPGQAHINRTGVCLITAYPPVCPRTSHLTTRHGTGTDTGTRALPQIRAPLSKTGPSLRLSAVVSTSLFFAGRRQPHWLACPPTPSPFPNGRGSTPSPSSSMQGTHVSGLRALADRESGLLAVLSYHLRTTLVLYLTCGNRTIRGGLWCGC